MKSFTGGLELNLEIGPNNGMYKNDNASTPGEVKNIFCLISAENGTQHQEQSPQGQQKSCGGEQLVIDKHDASRRR